jgi:DNA polymerase-3 subunit delta
MTLKNGNIKPIYFLMGEEPYYIDKLSDLLKKSFDRRRKGFNQTVLYGRDVSIEDIISTANATHDGRTSSGYIRSTRFNPNNRQIRKLCRKPYDNYVLVFCYKYKTLDKRKKSN